MINILVADNQLLTRKGIISVLSAVEGVCVIGHAASITELELLILNCNADVIIIAHFDIDDIKSLGSQFEFGRTLVLSNNPQKEEIKDIIQLGITNYVSKECSREELLNAVYSTARSGHFFCKRTSMTLAGNDVNLIQTADTPALSVRETEIIQLITGGMTNKEIAGQLFLSIHTVKTHRKNIIKKLGFTFKNAADLITYTQKMTD